MKATEQCFPTKMSVMFYEAFQALESVAERPKRDHPNESYWTVAALSRGVVYYTVQGGSTFGFMNNILRFDLSDEIYRNSSQHSTFPAVLLVCFIFYKTMLDNFSCFSSFGTH